MLDGRHGSNALVVSLAGLVLASATAAADEAPDQTVRLQEVVVTAQKRAENLQDVPVSVQVVGARALAEGAHSTLEDLTETLPGVHIQTGLSSNEIFIRGIGSIQDPSLDQSVAMFVDDIYHGRSRMSDAAFLDLDRVEVLRGPQSTFFGNNAVAGALNIVTANPGNAFEASVRGLYGMFGQYAAEGVVSGPLGGGFGARLAVIRDGDDRGWLDNVNLNQEVPRVNNLAGRLTLRYAPTANLDTTLKITGSDHRTTGASNDYPFQWSNCPPPPPFPASYGFPLCSQALASGGVPMGLASNRTTGLAGQGNHLSTFENVLSLNYRAAGYTLTSVSGFYNYHFNANVDHGDLPVDSFLTNQQPESYHQFSQELRLASPARGVIEYMAGAYFQTDRFAFNGESSLPELDFVPSLGGPFAQLSPYVPSLAAVQQFSQYEHVYSLFGNINWHVTDRLQLGAGLRASRDQKNATVGLFWGSTRQLYGGVVPMPASLQPILSFIAGPPGSDSGSRSDHAWMPSARLQYDFRPGTMAYVSYSRGFKAGGFDYAQNVQNGKIIPFDPEHVNAYEIGLKSKWLDDRLLLNFDIFRSDYSDLQVATGGCSSVNGALRCIFFVRNAATSRAEGAELELQSVIAERLRVSANVSYLRSYYGSYPDANTTSLQQLQGMQVQDLSGKPTDFAPRWSGSLTASYTVPIGDSYRFIAWVSPYFTSHYFDSGATDDPFFLIGDYVRVDGRLTLEGSNGRWGVDLIGKNLTDRTIVLIPGGASTGAIYGGAKEQPRNVVLQFRYRW